MGGGGADLRRAVGGGGGGGGNLKDGIAMIFLYPITFIVHNEKSNRGPMGAHGVNGGGGGLVAPRPLICAP